MALVNRWVNLAIDKCWSARMGSHDRIAISSTVTMLNVIWHSTRVPVTPNILCTIYSCDVPGNIHNSCCTCLDVDFDGFTFKFCCLKWLQLLSNIYAVIEINSVLTTVLSDQY